MALDAWCSVPQLRRKRPGSLGHPWQELPYLPHALRMIGDCRVQWRNEGSLLPLDDDSVWRALTGMYALTAYSILAMSEFSWRLRLPNRTANGVIFSKAKPSLDGLDDPFFLNCVDQEGLQLRHSYGVFVM